MPPIKGPLPHGKKLRAWIVEVHKNKGEPINLTDLRVKYHNQFNIRPDPFEILGHYRELVEEGALKVEGDGKTSYLRPS